MTNNTKTNKYRIPADQLQNLEIDRNGRVTPRLHDLDPLQNTLLSVLYPGIRVASVNVPTEPLDDYEESQVENSLARLVWNGVHYKLVGASGSAKKGKFYFVDQQHSRAIAERFQHWPQAAIVYFGILVSPCKVMMEKPEWWWKPMLAALKSFGRSSGEMIGSKTETIVSESDREAYRAYHARDAGGPFGCRERITPESR